MTFNIGKLQITIQTIKPDKIPITALLPGRNILRETAARIGHFKGMNQEDSVLLPEKLLSILFHE